MIEDQYNKTVNVQRLADGTGNVEEYGSHITGLSCVIQPLDESTTGDIEGGFGKDWLMFCGVEDILENDKIIDGSITYKVVGVESFEFLGEPRHMEVRIRKYNV